MTVTRAADRERTAQPETTVTVDVPHVPFPGATTDAEFIRGAAWRLRHGYQVGGSNVTATIAELLDRIATAVDGRPPQPDSDDHRARPAALDAAIEVVQAHWHNARRWQHPVAVQPIVSELVDALGPYARCDCRLCTGADERERNAS